MCVLTTCVSGSAGLSAHCLAVRPVKREDGDCAGCGLEIGFEAIFALLVFGGASRGYRRGAM